MGENTDSSLSSSSANITHMSKSVCISSLFGYEILNVERSASKIKSIHPSAIYLSGSGLWVTIENAVLNTHL